MFSVEKNILFSGQPNCLRITNGTIEIVATTNVGPRVLKYSLTGGENVFGLHPEARVETTLGAFKPYGGHRLWVAPEKMPQSYAPDNDPIECFINENKRSIRLVPPFEKATGMQKEIELILDETGSGVSVVHKIRNEGDKTIEAAAWAITIMKGGGKALIPNEDFAPHGDGNLLPIRNLALWSYTDLTDSRFEFTGEHIILRTDDEKQQAQKIGALNRKGFVKYLLNELEFTKKFEFADNENYPDLNSNTEIYTAGSYIEVETLSPLKKIAPGDSIEYAERWELEKT